MFNKCFCLFITFLFQGRFDLHQPLYECQSCQQQWTPDSKDLLRSGYWPASVSNSTLYTLDLLSSFQELKVIAPGFSRQAFAKLLEHRTKCGGRVSVIVITVINYNMSFHKQTTSQILFLSIYLPEWTYQRRCTAAELFGVFLRFF